MLDDYTKAKFPLDVRWNSGKVRLLAACSNRVIGYAFNEVERDGEVIECFSQVLDWSGQGIFGNGQYEHMNLVPPPAIVASKIAELEDRIASAQGRLDRMPDAPQEWRSIDEKAIEGARAKIAILRGD